MDELIDRILLQFPVSDDEKRALARMNDKYPAADEESRLRAALFWYHPTASVEAPPKPGRLCFNPPSRTASTAAWIRFRSELQTMIKDDPQDPEWPLYLARADEILAWRELIPAKHRFWRSD